MYYYKLRVDTTPIRDISTFLKQMDKDSDQYCYCYEGGETNPHIHFYIRTTVKMTTFRQHIIKNGAQGNGGYALSKTTPDPIEYISYMMKEKNFYQHTLSDILYKQALEYQEKKVDEFKQKKKTKPNHLNEIIKLASPYLENIDYYENQLKDIIIDYYKDNELNIQKYRLQTIFLTIYTRYSKNLDYVKTLIF